MDQLTVLSEFSLKSLYLASWHGRLPILIASQMEGYQERLVAMMLATPDGCRQLREVIDAEVRRRHVRMMN